MNLEQQLLARITADDRDALVEVVTFLGEAERSWSRIDRDRQCELNAMHHADGSLALCLRRAIQAAEELMAASTCGAASVQE